MNPSSATATPSWNYDRTEIIADGIIHVVGIALGIAGAVILVFTGFRAARSAEIASVAIYVVGLLSMLGMSAAYNCWPISPRKWMLRRFDHSAIYLLIAATYTPFLLHTMSGMALDVMLFTVWLTAAVGMALKLLCPGRFERLSIGFYLVLGWSGALAYKPIAAALQPTTLWLIAIGGALYSIGVLFHIWERLRFHTVIWHSFVLTAACCHYAAVLYCLMAAT